MEVASDTTQDVIDGCLQESQDSSLLLAVRTMSDDSLGNKAFVLFNQDLIFKYEVELNSEFLNRLQACVDKSVDESNFATQTLQTNAFFGECDDFKDSTVVSLIIEGASRSRVSPTISKFV